MGPADRQTSVALAIETVAADPSIRAHVARVSRRMAGSGVRAEDLEQEVWLEVIRRIQRHYDPEAGTLGAFVWMGLRQWTCEARRRLGRRARGFDRQDRSVDPEALVAPACTETADLARYDLDRLAEALEPDQRVHLRVRLESPSPAVCAERLGLSRRAEREAWARVRRLLGAAIEGGRP